MRIKHKIASLEKKLEAYSKKELTSNIKRQMSRCKNKIKKLQMTLKRHKAVAMINRTNGFRFEFKLLRKEKRNSVLSIRSAGSHSLIDLISIKKNGEVWLYNLKVNGYWSPDLMNRLHKLKSMIPRCCKIKLARYKNGKRFVVATLK